MFYVAEENAAVPLYHVCRICAVSGEVVRDHDHKTGFVRGLLCIQCNSWLGVFESNKVKLKRRGRHSYKAWEQRFGKRIDEYLKEAAEVVAVATEFGTKAA